MGVRPETTCGVTATAVMAAPDAGDAITPQAVLQIRYSGASRSS